MLWFPVSCIVFMDVLIFCCLFSYPSLLVLHYGGRIRKSQTTREQARKVGLLIREAEQRIDAELFLNEYPRCEFGAPHWSVILHKMFLHAAEGVVWGREAHLLRPLRQHIKTQTRGRPICHGTRGVPDLSQGDPRHLPQCLSVEKVPRSPTLWVSVKKRSNPQHPLLPKKPGASAGVSHCSWRDTRACRQTSV